MVAGIEFLSKTYIIGVLLKQTRLALLATRARAGTRIRAATKVVTNLSKTLLSWASVSISRSLLHVILLQLVASSPICNDVICTYLSVVPVSFLESFVCKVQDSVERKRNMDRTGTREKCSLSAPSEVIWLWPSRGIDERGLA